MSGDAAYRYVQLCTEQSAGACSGFDVILRRVSSISSRFLTIRDETNPAGLGNQWRKRKDWLWFGLALRRAVLVTSCVPDAEFNYSRADVSAPPCSESQFRFGDHFSVLHGAELDWSAARAASLPHAEPQLANLTEDFSTFAHLPHVEIRIADGLFSFYAILLFAVGV